MNQPFSLAESFQHRRADTIVISDLHMGSEVSLAKEARRMLKSVTFRRLILLGDIFCDLNFRRLKKDHWEFLSYIRWLSNPKRGVEVVWVEGNHDQGLVNVMSHLVGIPVFQEYSWMFAGQRHLAIHGHQFDRFVVNNGALSALGAFLFIHIQKFDSERKCIAKFLDHLNSQCCGFRLRSRLAQLPMQNSAAQAEYFAATPTRPWRARKTGFAILILAAG